MSRITWHKIDSSGHLDQVRLILQIPTSQNCNESSKNQHGSQLEECPQPVLCPNYVQYGKVVVHLAFGLYFFLKSFAQHQFFNVHTFYCTNKVSNDV